MSYSSNLELGRLGLEVVPGEADQRDLANQRNELLESLDKLVVAIKGNKDIQATASSLGEKVWWRAFTGAISGSNDKDLAAMVKQLGGSLETTQAVVQVMLRVQTRKDRLLREFQSVLVDKVASIQADTRTLSSNQRAVALEFVTALQDQIEDQLRQFEAVDRHELELREIGAVLDRTAEVEGEFRQALNALDVQAQSMQDAGGRLSREVETLHDGLKVLDAGIRAEAANTNRSMQHIEAGLNDLASKRADDSTAMHALVEKLRAALDDGRREASASLDVLSAKLAHHVTLGEALGKRVGEIEIRLAAMSTWRARLLRHSVGLVSLFVTLAVVFFSFRG